MLRHPQSPVLTWAADNLQASTDPAGNLKPDKAKSRQRIDPVVALLNGLFLWLRFGRDAGPSVYETRGVISLRPMEGR
jgi:phage terminase large subunit-like protein